MYLTSCTETSDISTCEDTPAPRGAPRGRRNGQRAPTPGTRLAGQARPCHPQTKVSSRVVSEATELIYLHPQHLLDIYTRFYNIVCMVLDAVQRDEYASRAAEIMEHVHGAFYYLLDMKGNRVLQEYEVRTHNILSISCAFVQCFLDCIYKQNSGLMSEASFMQAVRGPTERYFAQYFRNRRNFASVVLVDQGVTRVALLQQASGNRTDSFYTFPKGKVDAHEASATAAMREAFEETQANITRYLYAAHAPDADLGLGLFDAFTPFVPPGAAAADEPLARAAYTSGLWQLYPEPPIHIQTVNGGRFVNVYIVRLPLARLRALAPLTAKEIGACTVLPIDDTILNPAFVHSAMISFWANNTRVMALVAAEIRKLRAHLHPAGPEERSPSDTASNFENATIVSSQPLAPPCAGPSDHALCDDALEAAETQRRDAQWAFNSTLLGALQ